MTIITVEDLQKVAHNVSQTALALGSKINSAQNAVDRSIEMNIGVAPMLASRRNEWDQAASQIRRAVTKESDTARWDMLKAMSEGEQAALAAESQFASPSMILARAGLGSEQRSRYMEQIANAGPLELANFATHAQQTGNKVLGAVIAGKIEGLKPRERDVIKSLGVSRFKLAEALAGDDFRNAQNAIRSIKSAMREALAKNREFEHGKKSISARDRVGIALQRAGISK